MASNYGSKASEGTGKSKEVSSSSLGMIKGGGSGAGGGPTGSPTSYPKGGKVSMTPGFNPMHDKQRGATDYAVGGV